MQRLYKNYINRVECQTDSKVASLIWDNASEFKNTDLQNFFKYKGINNLTLASYTPEQNPFSKRGNQTTMNKSRFLLLDSGLDPTYWEEAANTPVYLENLTPHISLKFETLFSKWFNKTPSLKFLHPFISACDSKPEHKHDSQIQ
ncbi:hypothetical protein O181_075374 [Austropuccinia psidii MF-1]|uniref:Integrase catalytic domain-containing protein n=1 Tax=Austropuccinia psidii MF-1 TaxID=1389203 RepID=A0A9Q3IEE8_9BASI|nr:hypothetical protein [Austropuccinia psidii MF-1]